MLCQIPIPTCMHKAQVSFVNIKTLRIKYLQMYLIFFFDYNLSIHFGKDETKCILFRWDKNLPELNIAYNNNRTMEYRMVEYLVVVLTLT